MGSVGASRGSAGGSNIQQVLDRQGEAFTTEQTYQFNGQQAPPDVINYEMLMSQGILNAADNPEVNIRGTEYQIQPVMDWDNNTNKEYVAGHLYAPIGTLDKGSFFVSNEGNIWHDATQYLTARRNSIPLKGTDAVNVIDKNNLSYTYDRNRDVYYISKSDYDKVASKSKSQADYLQRIRADKNKGRLGTSSRAFRLS